MDELKFQSQKVGQTSYWLTSLSSMSIFLPIPGIRFFKIWSWKSRVKVIAKGHIVGPTSNRLISLLFQLTLPFLIYSFFLNLTLKIQGQGHGGGQGLKPQSLSHFLSIHIPFIQCLKLSQKSCRCSCLESQAINIKLKKVSVAPFTNMV